MLLMSELRDLFIHRNLELILWVVVGLSVALYLIDQKFLLRNKAFFSGSPFVLKGIKKSVFADRIAEWFVDLIILSSGVVFLLNFLVFRYPELAEDFVRLSLQVFLLYGFLILAKRYLFLFLEELLFLRKIFKPIHSTFRNDFLFISLLALVLTLLGMYNFDADSFYWDVSLYFLIGLVLFSYIKTYLLFKAYWLEHWFYFLLYLCALEIIPLIIFVRLISSFLST